MVRCYQLLTIFVVATVLAGTVRYSLGTTDALWTDILFFASLSASLVLALSVMIRSMRSDVQRASDEAQGRNPRGVQERETGRRRE